jgi:hypothetical protein
VAIFIGLVMGILLFDAAIRPWRSTRYIKTEDIYHRPPQTQVNGIFQDLPETRHSYSRVAPGYPDVPYTLTVDKRGFRNQADLEHYEVVVLGDSFAEGSKVSDDQNWPTIYATKSGLTVYNLGMSGGNPDSYLETYEKFGRALSPKMVITLIYEGNDFRGSGELVSRIKRDSSLRRRVRAYFKSSPVRLAFKRFIINTLSKAADERSSTSPSSRESDVLSWLPLAIPEGNNAKYYAFKAKKLINHYDDKKTFQRSPGCRTALLALDKINTICKSNHTKLIIMYAPDKPHVVMPLVRDRLPIEAVRNFIAFKKDDLP